MPSMVLKDLSYAYGGDKPVLNNISFQSREAESIGLIGANGVGKSTLLKVMVGLLLGYSGTLKINSIEVKKETLSEIRKTIGYVFQDSDSQLFLTTVYEDVAFAPRNYGFKPDEVERMTEDALRRVHMVKYRDTQIYRLSGGQKKLASIATVLSTDPEVLLLDEPSVGLDPKNRRNLIRIINELPGLKIIASHDLDFIWDTCGRTILLSDGTVKKDGNTSEILLNRELLESNGLELPLSLTERENV